MADTVVFMPSVSNPVLVTLSWLLWLRNSVGVCVTLRQHRKVRAVIYRSSGFETSEQIHPEPPKGPEQISSEADVSCAASGRQGSGNAALKTHLPSPNSPSPLLGAIPFIALAPLLRL